MDDQKRKFESEAPDMPALQPKAGTQALKKALPGPMAGLRGSKRRQPFTRQTVERLIKWLKEN